MITPTRGVPAHVVPPPEECDRRRLAMRAYIRGVLIWFRCVIGPRREVEVRRLVKRMRDIGWRGSTWQSAVRFVLDLRCPVCGSPAQIPDRHPTEFTAKSGNAWILHCQDECHAAIHNTQHRNYMPSPAEIAEKMRQIRAGELVLVQKRGEYKCRSR